MRVIEGPQGGNPRLVAPVIDPRRFTPDFTSGPPGCSGGDTQGESLGGRDCGRCVPVPTQSYAQGRTKWCLEVYWRVESGGDVSHGYETRDHLTP
jgi:hypothetical protein